MSCYIYQLPSWVLDDLCRNMDTLSEWDWMQFGEWRAREGVGAPRIRTQDRLDGQVGSPGLLGEVEASPVRIRPTSWGGTRLGDRVYPPHSAPQVTPQNWGRFLDPKGVVWAMTQPARCLPGIWPGPQHPPRFPLNIGGHSAPQAPPKLGGDSQISKGSSGL